jgi:hypothetical protein
VGRRRHLEWPSESLHGCLWPMGRILSPRVGFGCPEAGGRAIEIGRLFDERARCDVVRDVEFNVSSMSSAMSDIKRLLQTHTHTQERAWHTPPSRSGLAAPPGSTVRPRSSRLRFTRFTEGTVPTAFMFILKGFSRRPAPGPGTRAPAPPAPFLLALQKHVFNTKQVIYIFARVRFHSSPWRLRPSLFCRAWYALEDLRCCGRTHNLPPSMYLSLSLRAWDCVVSARRGLPS